MNDIITPEGILPYLNNINDFGQISVFESLKSTNDSAKDAVRSENSIVSVIIADNQTAGRGRYGRTFFSPPGHGIYMSLIIPSRQLIFDTPELITSFAAVAVCLAIDALTDKAPRIKPVNDVLINGKKICGILTEAVKEHIIIGIGINFTTPASNFPPEIRQTAASLFPDGSAELTRNRLIAEIINRIYDTGAFSNAEDMLNQYNKLLVNNQTQ